jgi:hypothetical protein
MVLLRSLRESLLRPQDTHEGVSKSFRTESIAKYMPTFGITRTVATQSVMAAKLTRLTHKIAIQLHLVAESSTICSSRSRRPVRKLLVTPSHIPLKSVIQRALTGKNHWHICRVVFWILSRWNDLVRYQRFLHHPPKLWYPTTSANGVTTQMTTWTNNAVLTWSLASYVSIATERGFECCFHVTRTSKFDTFFKLNSDLVRQSFHAI